MKRVVSLHNIYFMLHFSCFSTLYIVYGIVSSVARPHIVVNILFLTTKRFCIYDGMFMVVVERVVGLYSKRKLSFCLCKTIAKIVWNNRSINDLFFTCNLFSRVLWQNTNYRWITHFLWLKITAASVYHLVLHEIVCIMQK